MRGIILLDIFKQLDAKMTARIIKQLAQDFETSEALEAHLEKEVSEKELQEINHAALREGRQPLSFSFKQ